MLDRLARATPEPVPEGQQDHGGAAVTVPVVPLPPSASRGVQRRDGARIGANVLIGTLRTVELQPISVQQQSGTNVAAGVAEIELHFVR